MLLHDDLMYQVLLWLPVISLLRFKRVCRSWRALIENSYFIKQHLRLHHYDPSMKDKNHSLIHLFTGKDSSFTFRLISADSFEEPNACAQLDCLDLHRYVPYEVRDVVSYNGIMCLNLVKFKGEHSISLWNPATKQSRVLQRSPSLYGVFTTVGFGFDVRNNDYKVVNLIARSGCLDEKRVEVYSLNTNSWKRVTTVPSFDIYGNPRMPFNNGTCFYWWGYDSTLVNIGILCFDFSSEIFHSISFPRAVGRPLLSNASVVSDKIACVFKRNDDQFEIWVLNEYGRVNESWAKLYTISLYTTIDWRMPIELLSMNGKYIFFKGTEQMCRFNVATKETKNLSTLVKPTETFTRLTFRVPWVEFKESLVSIGGGNSAPTGVYKDSGKVFKEE